MPFEAWEAGGPSGPSFIGGGENMNDFLKSNSTKYRLLRTIAQGVLGVIVANLDVLLGFAPIDPAVKALIVAVVMAVLSPIMSELGCKGSGEMDKNDVPHGYFEDMEDEDDNNGE